MAIVRKVAVLSASGRLYLDHAATTPILADARAAISAALEQWANPSSPHADGRRVRGALEQARQELSGLLDWRHDVIFTSGATEAIQIAAARARAPARIVGPTEHEAVLAAMGPDATHLSVDGDGRIDLVDLSRRLEEGPALVAVQLVNNETGVIQSIDTISKLVHGAGSLLLTDCAQAAGKIAVPDADFVAVSGHKFGGPPGIGALLVRDFGALEASGGQERGYRRGTESWPSVAGMVAALKSKAFMSEMPRLTSLRTALEREIEAAGGIIVAPHAPRIATIGAYGMPGVTSASQLVQLDLAAISVSAGSACSSGSMKSSHVLRAMALPEEIARSVVRVSFGPSTSETDIERFVAEWRRIAARAKRAAA